MDELEVVTVIHLPPEEVFEFLVDFPGYASYTEYLTEVRQDGDGGEGTRYDLVLSWWKLSYTANSRVTGIERPERIDWEIVEDIDAEGAWHVEEAPEEAPDGVETASRVRFRVAYDIESVRSANLDLPAFVSMGWVIEKIKPLAKKEIAKVVKRIVTDLEGEPRDVTVEIRTGAVDAR